MDNEKTLLALGAMLHDIGKFKQRAGFEQDRGKTHSQIGYEWLSSIYDRGQGLVPAAALNHHGSEDETWQSNLSMIVYEADNCSAAERKTKYESSIDVGKKWHRQVQLKNIFTLVRNPDPRGKQETPADSYWRLQSQDLWPQPENNGENTENDYRVLWNQFENDFNSLKKFGNHLQPDVVVHLLEKYTAFIPSITLKITAVDPKIWTMV
jgi:CRISPR-associated protein Csm1